MEAALKLSFDKQHAVDRTIFVPVLDLAVGRRATAPKQTPAVWVCHPLGGQLSRGHNYIRVANGGVLSGYCHLAAG